MKKKQSSMSIKDFMKEKNRTERLNIATLAEERRIEELPQLFKGSLPYTLALALFALADFLVTGGSVTLTVEFNHILTLLGITASIPL